MASSVHIGTRATNWASSVHIGARATNRASRVHIGARATTRAESEYGPTGRTTLSPDDKMVSDMLINMCVRVSVYMHECLHPKCSVLCLSFNETFLTHGSFLDVFVYSVVHPGDDQNRYRLFFNGPIKTQKSQLSLHPLFLCVSLSVSLSPDVILCG